MNILSVIIVNWNAAHQLRDCLNSIVQHQHGFVAEVIIVDNASTDNSIILVESLLNLPFRIQIIRNSTNEGFAKACNKGAMYANGGYLLFLNPDAALYADTLPRSLAFMQDSINKTIGICGVQLLDESGNAATSAARFPTLRVMAGQILGLTKIIPALFPPHFMRHSDFNNNGLVDQVIGAFFLIRRNVFDSCNGFDERFFVYFEEVDLSLRAKELGHTSYCLADVFAFHKGGGCSEQVKSARLFYSLRSRIFYAKKHYSMIEFIALIFLTWLELPLRLFRGILRGSLSDINNTFLAYARLTAYFIRKF